MRKLLDKVLSWMDNPNEYSECPKCKEWEWQNSNCNACGYYED